MGTTVALEYVHTFTDRTGKVRRYFRLHGKRTPLPGLPGSREFMDAYAAMLARQAPPVERRPEAVPRSFADLAKHYYGSGKYRGLAVSSRANYRRVIDHFLEKHGHRLAGQMVASDIDLILGDYAGRSGAGAVLLKRIRTLVHYGIKPLGWLTADPTLGADAGHTATEFHTWTEDEIAQFERRWEVGTRQRLGFALALYTGQRGSDVHRMTWGDVAGDLIRVAQRKTKTRLAVPLHPELAAILAGTKRSQVAILTTAYGLPFSVKGYGNMMSTAIGAAGLPTECKAHGLRKAAARRLAEAGATEKQIGAVTGHKTLAEIERYTRAADQERLAREAIRKQVASEAARKFATG